MSQIAFSPPPTVKVLCNLCSVDAGPFPSPMQAAAAVLDLGWFNHGVKVSICPVCLAYYRMVFQNPSLPGLAETLQSQAENVVEMPSRNLMVLKHHNTASEACTLEIAVMGKALAILPLLCVGDPVFLTSEKDSELGITGHVSASFRRAARYGFSGYIELSIIWVPTLGAETERFWVHEATGRLSSDHGMCYLLTAVAGSVLERLQQHGE